MILFIVFPIFAHSADLSSSPSTKDEQSLRRYLYYAENDSQAPYYRKAFDEYIIDLEHIQKFNKLPYNSAKESDFLKMRYDVVVPLK